MPHPHRLRDPIFDLEGLDPRSAAVFGAFMLAQRRHHQLMLRVLAEQETPPGQAICLRILAAHEGATQRELGDMLHVSAPTMTAMLKRMERSGTIAREPDATDQRVTRVRLTAAGQGLERGLSALLATRIGRLLETMADRDRRDLARLLRDLSERMAGAMGEPAAGGATGPAAAGGAAGPAAAGTVAKAPR